MKAVIRKQYFYLLPVTSSVFGENVSVYQIPVVRKQNGFQKFTSFCNQIAGYEEKRKLCKK